MHGELSAPGPEGNNAPAAGPGPYCNHLVIGPRQLQQQRSFIMKERISYLLHVSEQGFDPSLLTVTKDSLALPPIKAAKEHRLTFGLSELPHEVATYPSLSRQIQIAPPCSCPIACCCPEAIP